MFHKLGNSGHKGGPPPESQEFAEPWRKIKWDDNHLEQNLRTFKASHPEVQQLRILVVGPVGAGKSSFIKSVNNVFQGRITSVTLADTTAGKSFTKIYRSIYIEGKDGKPLAFVLIDSMGLETERGYGAHEEDIFKALRGFVQDGCRFNPESPIPTDDRHYRSNPDVKDRISCLVYVLSADKVSIMDSGMFNKMKLIREKATELNIPQAIVMTKPDEVCSVVRSDLRKIYTSKKIKEKMEMCSNLVGVTMDHIFPVKNYHEEMDTTVDMNVLILKALDQIVHIANDSLKNLNPDTSNRSSAQLTQSAPDGLSLQKKTAIVDPLLSSEAVTEWLSNAQLQFYATCFLTAGYDLQTISRMTPEDLTAIGVTKPGHRKRLLLEISKLKQTPQDKSSPEAVAEWLSSVQLEFYTTNFLTNGYDLQTISTMTTEDLTAIGVTNPSHRKMLLSEISRLDLPDWIPKEKTISLAVWLSLIGLSQYYQTLVENGYDSMDFISDITLDDLEEIDITKMGHQKKLMFAISHLREPSKEQSYQSGRSTAEKPKPPPIHPKPIKTKPSRSPPALE